MGLIDAYKAMKSIDEIVCSMSVCINSDYCHGMTAMKDAAIHAIEKQPTVDAALVVRCGKCKRRYKPMDDDARNEIWCEFIGSMMRKDDFCSHGCADGERKDEVEEGTDG